MPASENVFVKLTAKKIGPGFAPAREARAKVYYLKPADLDRIVPDTVRGNAILFVKNNSQAAPRKVDLLETPNEVAVAQAWYQGATASPNFAANWQGILPTSVNTDPLHVTSKYWNDIITGGIATPRVFLPDPFVRKLAIVNNTTTAAITVFARGTTSPINGSTAGYSVPAGGRIHFSAPTAATAGTTAGWKVATDA